MKFSIGDIVILKRTGEEGHVTAYINEQMLEVEVGGTTFPVYIADVDHPYLKWFTEKKIKKKSDAPLGMPVTEKQAFRKPRLAKGIYLSFLPVFKTEAMEDLVDHFKIYLLNELPVPIQLNYDARFLQGSEFRHTATLHAFGHLYLHHLSFEDMSSQPRFHWQLAHTDHQTAEGILRIRPARLFEHITDVLHKSEPTFSYLLIEDLKPLSEQRKEEKNKWLPPAVPPRKKNITSFSAIQEQPRYEVDLHIEQLVDNYSKLSNAEIIKIQLDTVQHYLHLSIVHRQQRMVIIHGLGKGILRDAVHKILKHTPEVSHYANDWQGKYGFGATEVHLKV